MVMYRELERYHLEGFKIALCNIARCINKYFTLIHSLILFYARNLKETMIKTHIPKHISIDYNCLRFIVIILLSYIAASISMN